MFGETLDKKQKAKVKASPRFRRQVYANKKGKRPKRGPVSSATILLGISTVVWDTFVCSTVRSGLRVAYTTMDGNIKNIYTSI